MTEQWQELKETIIELRDNDGTCTQQEVCKFLANLMDLLEKQIQEPCEDAISRSDAIRVASGYCHWSNIPKELAKLPSVNPIPCEDAISRQAVLEKSYKIAGYDRNAYVVDVADIEALSLVSTEKIGQWISVSERLPEAEYGESDSVLVCFENGTQDVLYFNGGNWCYPTGEVYISVNHKNGWHNKVVAWMPLQKPYDPQESEDKE